MTIDDITPGSVWMSRQTQRIATINFVTSDLSKVNYYFSKNEPSLVVTVEFFLDNFVKQTNYIPPDPVLGEDFKQSIPKPTHEFPHYYKYVGHLEWVDVYRIGNLFQIQDKSTGCISHAVKKLLVCGQRGYKDQSKDIKEAIATLERYLIILEEDICFTP